MSAGKKKKKLRWEKRDKRSKKREDNTIYEMANLLFFFFEMMEWLPGGSFPGCTRTRYRFMTTATL